MAVAYLQGWVTVGNPALQLLPGKDSSGFQLLAILTFPQRKCRAVSASPHPKMAQGTLAPQGIPKPTNAFPLQLSPAPCSTPLH